MSTIKVRSMSIDAIGYRTVRLLYSGLPSVRSLVHGWFDGDPAFLLKRENREFLRRLVVRSLKELSYVSQDALDFASSSNEENGSYGGTSSDEDNTVPFREDIFDLSGPFVYITEQFLSTIGAEVSICGRCGITMSYVTTIRSFSTHHFHGVCTRCCDSLKESELLDAVVDNII